jgi:hypothetical protein
VPLPLAATETVASLTKVAVSVSVFEAVKVQGLVVPEHVPPDQPLKRLPPLGVSLIEIESPVKTEQLFWAVQWTRESVTVAVPLPLVAAVIVTTAAAWAIGPPSAGTVTAATSGDVPTPLPNGVTRAAALLPRRLPRALRARLRREVDALAAPRARPLDA